MGPSVRAQHLRYHAPGHVFISTELVGYLITYLFTQLILYNQTTPSHPFNAHLIPQFCPKAVRHMRPTAPAQTFGTFPSRPLVQLHQIT